MAIHRRMRFVRGQFAWMVAVVLGLALLGAFSYELFFVLVLIGFLVVGELTAPANVTPEWRGRLHVLCLLGLTLFTAIAGYRILDVLSIAVIHL